VLLSLALMTADQRFHHVDALRKGLNLLVYPVQYVVDLPFRIGDWLAEQLVTHNTLVGENRKLRREALLDDAHLQRLAALEEENDRLRQLLHASSHVKAHFTVAELLSADMAPFRQEILINKGSHDGVYLGQPLLDARGVMGQVTDVNYNTARVTLISDPSQAVPVQVNRNGLRSLAVGTGNPQRLELRSLPNSADIRVGDIVSTSGLGGRYPPDYPVGEVVKIDRDPAEAFAQIEVRPLAHLERSREVLLVWPANEHHERPGATDKKSPPATKKEHGASTHKTGKRRHG
jgi:rod shape-determining protein MreC